MILYSLKNGLKRARKEANLTQQQLADEIRVHVKTIMNWEQGVAKPSLDTLLQLANFYNCDLDYLTGKIECKTHDLQFICDQTRLSQEAVLVLQKIASRDRATGNSRTLSHFIEDPDFPYFIALMGQTQQEPNPPFAVGNAYIATNTGDVINMVTRDTFAEILNRVHLKEQQEPSADEEKGMYGLAYGLFAENKLTDVQLQEVIEHYDNGDFDFVPEGFKNNNKE